MEAGKDDVSKITSWRILQITEFSLMGAQTDGEREENTRIKWKEVKVRTSIIDPKA